MEIDKVYEMTKSSKELVKIVSIDKKGTGCWVIYIGREHLRVCPSDTMQIKSKPIDLMEQFEHWFDIRIKYLELKLQTQIRELSKK